MTAALNMLRCGTLNKIGVALDRDAAADLADGWHVNFPAGDDASDDRIATVDVIGGTHPQAVVFAGGSFGEYLEKQGRAAMCDYAENCLVDLFGGSVGGAISDMIATVRRDERPHWGHILMRCRTAHQHVKNWLSRSPVRFSCRGGDQLDSTLWHLPRCLYLRPAGGTRLCRLAGLIGAILAFSGDSIGLVLGQINCRIISHTTISNQIPLN